MSRINFGVLKAGLFHTLTESLDKNDTLNQDTCVSFYSLVKETPFLHLENIFYKNMLNKYVSNGEMAMKYIDENVNLFKSFSKKDYTDAHSKLEPYKVNYKPQNINLLNAIDTLLYESLRFQTMDEIPNIDSLHEAYEVVLENIKKPKLIESEPSKLSGMKSSLKESILKTAISKFNEKYSHLSEDDKALIKILTTQDVTAKKNLFETLKVESYEKLQKSLNTAHELVVERIRMSMDKIEKMKFNEETVTPDIIKLHYLKNNKK